MYGLTTFNRNFVNPYQEFESIARRMFGGENSASDFSMDIKDNGDSYELKADMPGVDKDDIHIDLDGDRLTISAERHSEFEEKDKQGNFVRCERSYGSFSRSIDVSSIDTDKLNAAYENGVLTLTMPKRESVQPSARRIPIA